MENPDYIFYDGRVVGFGAHGIRVETVPPHVVRAMMAAWHYSGTWVNNAYINLGVYRGRDLMGGMQLGYAMHPNSGKRIVTGTGNREYLELNRLWLHGSLPKCTGSQVLRYALKFIRREYPRVGWVQSFADARCKLGGVIYQAANFCYLGSHVSPMWELDGQWYHKIAFTAVGGAGGARGEFLRKNADRAVKHEFEQYRYIKFLHKGARRRLTMAVMPYPKQPRV